MQEPPQSSEESGHAPAVNSSPSKYVGYTRPGSLYGTPEQALALADAYAGFQVGFFVNAILSITLWAFVGFVGGELPDMDAIIIGAFIAVAVITGWVNYYPARSYAFGAGRSPTAALPTCIMLGLQSWFCFGMFGFAVIESRVMEKLKKYGVRVAFLGVKKEDLQMIVHQMSFSAAPPPPVDPANPSTHQER